MGNYGIKVSTPGSDVLTAEDKNLVYSSKYNGMKILTHGSLSTSGSVAHNLGYVPMFLNYRCSNGTCRPDAILDGSGALDAYNFTPAYANTTHIVFPKTNNYYFIFVDRVA